MIKFTFTRTFLLALGLAAIVPVVMVAQLIMLVSTYEDAREVAIQQWASNNPDSATIVQRYRDACQAGLVKDGAVAKSSGPKTFEACAAEVGSPSLVSAISEATKTVDATISSPAPLRWAVQ